MFIAINQKGERIEADNGDKEDTYTCECCNAPVYFKKGQVKQSHFAHKNNKDCDTWHEMSEWHRKMQAMFPVKYREIVLEKDGEKHRADILVKHKGITFIVEFQKSNISREEIIKRSEFYSSFGKLLWVFNFNDRHIHEDLEPSRKIVRYWWDWATKSVLSPKEFAKMDVDLCFEVPNECATKFIFPVGSEYGEYKRFYALKNERVIGEKNFIQKLRNDYFKDNNWNRINFINAFQTPGERRREALEKEYDERERIQKEEEEKERIRQEKIREERWEQLRIEKEERERIQKLTERRLNAWEKDEKVTSDTVAHINKLALDIELQQRAEQERIRQEEEERLHKQWDEEEREWQRKHAEYQKMTLEEQIKQNVKEQEEQEQRKAAIMKIERLNRMREGREARTEERDDMQMHLFR